MSENNEISQNKEIQTAIQHKLAAMFSANRDEVSIPKIYIDMTDDIQAAAVLDELMFWTLPKRGTGRTSLRVFKKGELWLAVRRKDWWDRKRLTERQADGAIVKLIKLELIEKDVFLFGGKPTMHIRMRMDNFVRMYGEKIKELAEQEDDENLVKDISDLYEMMGFPHQTVISNSPNGEMLNSPNGEFINNLQQPPNTSIDSPISDSAKEEKPKYGSEERKEKLRKEISPKSGLDWDIMSGEKVTEEKIDYTKIEQEALHFCESAFQLPRWDWYSSKPSREKSLKEMRDKVIEIYRENKNLFRAYQTWRNQPYVRGAMSNIQMKNNPENFPISWSDFLAANPNVSNASKMPKEGGEVVDDGNIYIG